MSTTAAKPAIVPAANPAVVPAAKPTEPLSKSSIVAAIVAVVLAIATLVIVFVTKQKPGPDGIKGPTGAAGNSGSGVTGDPGQNGSQGATGPTGPKGSKGAQGEAGEFGVGNYLLAKTSGFCDPITTCTASDINGTEYFLYDKQDAPCDSSKKKCSKYSCPAFTFNTGSSGNVAMVTSYINNVVVDSTPFNFPSTQSQYVLDTTSSFFVSTKDESGNYLTMVK